MNCYLKKENEFYIGQFSGMDWQPAYTIEIYVNDVHELLQVDINDKVPNQDVVKLFNKLFKENVSSLEVGGRYLFSYNPSGVNLPPFKPWTVLKKDGGSYN